MAELSHQLEELENQLKDLDKRLQRLTLHKHVTRCAEALDLSGQPITQQMAMELFPMTFDQYREISQCLLNRGIPGLVLIHLIGEELKRRLPEKSVDINQHWFTLLTEHVEQKSDF